MSFPHSARECASPTANTREQTLRKPPSKNGLKCTAPSGSRPKSKVNAGGSALGRSATISHSPTPKIPSPSRGPALTVRIENDMTANISQPIQSAPPARTIRRLPIPPSSSLPPTSSTTLPKYFTDTPLNPNDSLTPKRTPRPLPCPPPLPKDNSYCSTATPEAPSPTARPPTRVVRPLPMPVQKIDPLPSKLDNTPLRVSSPKPPPRLPPLVDPAWTSPLKPLGEKSNYSEEKKTHNGSRTPRKNEWKGRIIHADHDDESEEGVHDKENHCDGEISLLQKHFVLLAPPRASLDSDMSTSDDGEFVVANSSLDLVDTSVKSAKSPTNATWKALSSPNMNGDVYTEFLEDGEGDLHVDYAWVLSNRILYHQSSQQHASKWVMEKKGKRYTEQDYENILKVLRTL